MISPGDIYEDCAFHPVLCLRVDDDEVEGISLIDGSQPRRCSISHCGVQRLGVRDVIDIKADFDAYVARRQVGFILVASRSRASGFMGVVSGVG